MENKDIFIFCGVLIVIAFIGWYGNYSANQRLNDKLDVIDYFADEVSDEDMKEAFVDGCMEEDASREYCVCTYDYFSSRITNSELFDLAIEVGKGNYPDILFDAVEHCIKYW